MTGLDSGGNGLLASNIKGLRSLDTKFYRKLGIPKEKIVKVSVLKGLPCLYLSITAGSNKTTDYSHLSQVRRRKPYVKVWQYCKRFVVNTHHGSSSMTANICQSLARLDGTSSRSMIAFRIAAGKTWPMRSGTDRRVWKEEQSLAITDSSCRDILSSDLPFVQKYHPWWPFAVRCRQAGAVWAYMYTSIW